jgi:uncharacterized membrane protein YhhN
MNPTLRGFLIVALIALAIVVLQLYQTLEALFLLARIAFLLAIAFFVYLVWREQRGSIELWPTRARVVFYGAALLIVADFGVWFLRGIEGRDAFAFVVVLVLCGYSMWRVWRDQHTFS